MRNILTLLVLMVAEVTSIQAVADPIKRPDCVDALEQIVVLRMPVAVWIEEDRFHRNITASERRLELVRLTKIVRSTCAKDPKVREQQNIESRSWAEFMVGCRQGKSTKLTVAVGRKGSKQDHA